MHRMASSMKVVRKSTGISPRRSLKPQPGKKSEVPPNPHRICAYCLKKIPLDKGTICAHCNVRAYCSDECKESDWSSTGEGQWHSKWCALRYGEEGVHWDVTFISEEKGLGVTARHDMPKGYRIMVDGNRPKTHDRIDELMPLDGNRQRKIERNSFVFADRDRNGQMVEGINRYVVCLRVARVNHSCDPNAEHMYDRNTEVCSICFIK